MKGFITSEFLESITGSKLTYIINISPVLSALFPPELLMPTEIRVANAGLEELVVCRGNGSAEWN